MSAVSSALTPHGQGPHRRVREPGAWGPAPPPYLFADSRVLERRRLMAPFSLQVWGQPLLRAAAAGRRDPAPVWCAATRRRGSLLAGRSRDARALRAVAATRRQPTGAPWGPAGATVCVLDTSPGSPTARCVRCAGMLLDGLHLWFVHTWCYSGANGNGMLARGSPPSAAAATFI